MTENPFASPVSTDPLSESPSFTEEKEYEFEDRFKKEWKLTFKKDELVAQNVSKDKKSVIPRSLHYTMNLRANQ